MTNQKSTFKVALVGDCLASGGAEKVHALLSIYFQKSGLEVYNYIFVDWVVYDYKGSLLNLGKIKPNSFFITRKITRFFTFKKSIKEEDFDVVIDFRMRTNFILELLLSKWVYPKSTFYTVRSGILAYYFPKPFFLTRTIYKKRKIITVSKAIQNLILEKKLSNAARSIYNPIDFESIDLLKDQYQILEEKFILASGRMNDVKQFDKLIVAYSQSVLPKINIKLILLGEGENQTKYKALAEQLGLQDKIVFKGFLENPFPYYQKALYLVLTSKNEGFPNVLTEALATGIPVISFDCFSGPNEIITDQQNGILIEDQNFEKLTEAMNEMVSNKNLYLQCKSNAKASVKHFSLDIIGAEWLQLFKLNT